MENSSLEFKRAYQNHFLDSTRWEHVAERSDDIIIATPYKSGTTWMQNIVLHLIFQDLKVRDIGAYSAWVEIRTRPIEDLTAILDAQQHRRCIKSHLPFDGIPFRPSAKYIVVGRDPRDVFMSLWNHYSAYTPELYSWVNDTPDRVGPPLEHCPDDIREFWDMWINRGWFDWETEGYPHWSNFRHVQTWWDNRHLQNILFVHFNDLLSSLEGEILRIANFLEIDCAPDVLSAITDIVTFKSMKRDAEILEPDAHEVFKGGAKTFINKGTNGRWRGVLTTGDLAMYDAAVKRELSPDCHKWLEQGLLVNAANIVV